MEDELAPRPEGAEPSATAAAEAPPAEFGVSAIDADGSVGLIFTCAPHLAATVRIMQGRNPAAGVFAADPGRYGCKGCQERWTKD